ncbi:FIGfam010717, partial [hydrothermal vent metagenome]
MRLLPVSFGVALYLLMSLAHASDRDLIIVALNNSIDKFQLAANSRLLDWQQLIESHRNSSVKKKLSWVNTFFNKVHYQTDEKLWGKTEYWATPIELLMLNQGDCEDYAIAKYFTLRAMGVPAEQLRIVYVHSLSLKQAHMVLMYKSKNELLVLDNAEEHIKSFIDRKDLVPVYSFNSLFLWLPDKSGGEER